MPKSLVCKLNLLVNKDMCCQNDILEARQAIIGQFDELVSAIQAYDNEMNMIEDVILKSHIIAFASIGKES